MSCVQEMERSRETSGGGERRRERSEERGGGGRPTSDGRQWQSQDRSRTDLGGAERGSSRRREDFSSRDNSGSGEAERMNLERGSLRRRDDLSGRDTSGRRETERINLGRGDSRDQRGREFGRGGSDSRERSSSYVSTKVEGGSGRVDENKEVWEAPMPGEWQPTEGMNFHMPC